MKFTTVLFDLDGTLLPMDNDAFTKAYFKLLAGTLAPHGYEPEKLVDAVWKGTAAMVKNDGAERNETVFWRTFAALCGESVLDDQPLFQKFYETEFQKARSACGFDPSAAELVYALKERGFRVALATNPIFPSVATESRIRWAGLTPEDFALFTTYENTSWCKPNPAYYRDVAARLGVQPEECLMVGNDMTEDMIAESTGMQLFLLTDCLINRKNESLERYPHGDFSALREYIGL